MYILSSLIDWKIVIICIFAIVFFAIVGYYSDKAKMKKDKEKLKSLDEKYIDNGVVNKIEKNSTLKTQPMMDNSKIVEKTKEESKIDIINTEKVLQNKVTEQKKETEIFPFEDISNASNNNESEQIVMPHDSILSTISTPTLQSPNTNIENHISNYDKMTFEDKSGTPKQTAIIDDLDLGTPPNLKTANEKNNKLDVEDIFRF